MRCPLCGCALQVKTFISHRVKGITKEMKQLHCDHCFIYGETPRDLVRKWMEAETYFERLLGDSSEPLTEGEDGHLYIGNRRVTPTCKTGL